MGTDNMSFFKIVIRKILIAIGCNAWQKCANKSPKHVINVEFIYGYSSYTHIFRGILKISHPRKAYSECP
jgi:hypothetical protein